MVFKLFIVSHNKYSFRFLWNLKSWHSPFLILLRQTIVSWCPKLFLTQCLCLMLPLTELFLPSSCIHHVSVEIFLIKALFSCSVETSPVCVSAHCFLPTRHLLQPSIVYVLSCFPVYYPPLSLSWKHNETKDHKIPHSSLPDTVKWPINIFKWMNTHEEMICRYSLKCQLCLSQVIGIWTILNFFICFLCFSGLIV